MEADKKDDIQKTTTSSCCPTVPVKTERTVTHTPAIDVLEKPDEILVLADLPGVKSGDVDLEFDAGVLTLNANVAVDRDDSGKTMLREYAVGAFRRSFRIGDGIDFEAIRAEMADGVLTLHLPKREAAKARKVPVVGTT